jgi:hypothetical protein
MFINASKKISGDGTLSVMDIRAKKAEPFAHSEDQEDELLSILPINGYAFQIELLAHVVIYTFIPVAQKSSWAHNLVYSPFLVVRRAGEIALIAYLG